jgi:hypothetical protein
MASEVEIEAAARVLCPYQLRPCPGDACGCCTGIAKAALEAAERARWQPIETAPNEYCTIVVATVDGDVWAWNMKNGPTATTLTHWQPFPSPPESKA